MGIFRIASEGDAGFTIIGATDLLSFQQMSHAGPCVLPFQQIAWKAAPGLREHWFKRRKSMGILSWLSFCSWGSGFLLQDFHRL